MCDSVCVTACVCMCACMCVCCVCVTVWVSECICVCVCDSLWIHTYCFIFLLALAIPNEDGIINPFAKKYRKSDEYSHLKTELDDILEKAKDIPVTPPRTYAINYFWQVR